MSVPKIYVDGQEGTTGLRLLDYLGARSDLELLRIDEALRKDPAERKRLLNAADVAFLCLPDAAAREAVAMIDNPNTCLIDASTAHRTLADWVYGLPELCAEQRTRLRSEKRIAVPGCHASAFVLLLRPLIDAGLIAADAVLSAFSITGYTGGGKKMIADYEAPDRDARLSSPRHYALDMNHKHLPEMRHHTGLSAAPIFNPVVAAFAQGLAVTVPLSPAALGTSLDAIHAAWAARYQNEGFVQVFARDATTDLDHGMWDIQACNGTNRADLAVFGNDQRAVLIARLDNLGKGAAGAAVQCLNLHLGVDEATGLLAAV